MEPRYERYADLERAYGAELHDWLEAAADGARETEAFPDFVAAATGATIGLLANLIASGARALEKSESEMLELVIGRLTETTAVGKKALDDAHAS